MTTSREPFNLIFNTVIEPRDQSVLRRISYRMIVLRDNKYLMLETKRGDLLFPGGGIEPGETKEEAAIRELVEETGYLANSEPIYLGQTLIIRKDRFLKDKIFEMETHYYGCSVHELPINVALTISEINLEFKPGWFAKDEIVQRNRNYNESLEEEDIWVVQEEAILMRLNVG